MSRADKNASGAGRTAGSIDVPVRQVARQLQIGIDLSILLASFLVAYLLRYEFNIPSQVLRELAVQLPVVLAIQLAVIYTTGIYQFIWRYVGLAELRTFVRAAFYSSLPLFFLRFGLTEAHQEWRVPLSIIVMDSGLAFGGLLAARILRRLVYERRQRLANREPGRPVLLVGTGPAGVLIAKELKAHPDSGLTAIGFVDIAAGNVGSVVQGVKVLGTTDQLEKLVARYKISEVIITLSEASRDEIRKIVERCEAIPVKMRIIPGLHEILEGRVEISRLREVRIEDLLGREPVFLDSRKLRHFLQGKRVMVTGAGGSIGSEIARQVARYEPAAIALVERAEPLLFQIDQSLRAQFRRLPIAAVLGDVGDESRMRTVLAKHRPQVIFHAAAHKHVPMMETNSAEAVLNNVLATQLLGELAGEFETETFVLISTDKAVRPTSVMGASKRVAELVAQRLNQRLDTDFMAVRFGNVLGSTGSVIPIFRQQIAQGGPVTVTHAEMTRYFMTIPEASQLVLQAAALGGGGEIFLLDMGEPVKIIDVAEDMIVLSGLRPYVDIEIDIVGPRAGEKLREELQLASEEFRATEHPKILVGGSPPADLQRIEQATEQLRHLAAMGLDEEIRLCFNRVLGEARVSREAPA